MVDQWTLGLTNTNCGNPNYCSKGRNGKFYQKTCRNGSSTSSSMIDEQLRQIQDNTQRYDNKLSVSIEDWEH